MKTWKIILFSAIFLACGKGDFGKKTAQIEVTPIDLNVEIPEAIVGVGQTYSYPFMVHNVGSKALEISRIEHTYKGCDKDKEDALTFEVEKGVKFPLVLEPKGSGTGKDSLQLVVHYKRPPQSCAGRQMDVIIHNNSDDAKLRDLKVSFVVQKAVPKIGASPAVVDFGQIQAGNKGDVDLSIKNVGAGKLLIKKIIYRAERPGFSFKMDVPNKGDTVFPIPEHGSGTLEFDKPIELWDYESINLNVIYKAMDGDPANADLFFITNDENFPPPDGFNVHIQANVGGPCLKADPPKVDFGAVTKGNMGVEVVNLVGCGDQDVSITSIKLSDDSSKDFALDLSGLDHEPSKSNPLIIQPKMTQKLVVKFQPIKVDKDANGGIIPDIGSIVVDNSSPTNPLKVGLEAMGVDATAPVADFEMEARICTPPTCNPSNSTKCTTKIVKNGDTVPPQTFIQMHDLSKDPTPGGKVSQWKWSLSGPPESNATYIPSPEFPEPSVCLNVSGDYTFMLSVMSKTGIPSETAQKSLKVSSGEGLHIELTWHTPNDPDETDTCGSGKDCGSDMDLHFLHPNAYGQGVPIQGVTNPGYFNNNNWDCYWNNPHPIWVKPDQVPPGEDPNPNLDRDDTDGAGPENLNLKNPQLFQNGACYRVGVHYFDDHGYGASFAVLKVYINGVLKWQNKSGVRMNMLDLWDALEICWASSADKVKIKPVRSGTGSGVVIYHDVKSGFQ